MLLIDNIVNLLRNKEYDSFRNSYFNNEFTAVKWSWVVRKLNSELSIEEIYNILYPNRALCAYCKINKPTHFISFKMGYSKYCSRSCSKSDPLVEIRKKQSLDKNPLWRATSTAKRKCTNISRYGGISVFSSNEILEKRKRTNLAKYGAAEILASNSVIRAAITKNIGADKFFNRVDNFDSVSPLFSPVEYQKNYTEYAWHCSTCNNTFLDNASCGSIPKCVRCYPLASSKGERELYDYVAELCKNENVKSRYKFRSEYGLLEIDVYIPDRKIGFEFNGIYWHSESRGTPKDYHLNKKKACEQHGIRLLQFWDVEWETKKNIVKSIILSVLGLSKKINARQCVIKNIDSKTSQRFLIENHLSGSVLSASTRLGLFFNDVLVSVATFSKLRFQQKSSSIELLRLCTLLNHTVIGGAAKLIHHFNSTLNNLSVNIVSYCNDRVFNGNVYKVLGFKKVNSGKPACWYFKSDGVLKHRSSYQKKKLLELLGLTHSTETEWELAQKLKLNRVWDCGNSKWQLDVN